MSGCAKQITNSLYETFEDPNLLPEDVFQAQFRERQRRAVNYTLSLPNVTLGTAFLFAEGNIEFDFEQVVQPTLDILLEEQDPDFHLSKQILWPRAFAAK